jgi:hypothetical protein
VAIVLINYDDQRGIELNVFLLNKHTILAVTGDFLMPRFYFDLESKDACITDENGKQLDTLHDAYEHARKLIHKIVFHVGYDDADAWTMIILNDQHDAQMILPFSVSHAFKSQRRKTG